MNPYTKKLLDQLYDEELKKWVIAWDSWEELVIDIYRAGAATPTNRDRFTTDKIRLLQGYELHKDDLTRHWGGLLAGGEPLEQDPFLRLLSAKAPADFVENWTAMKLLPAAREALNLYLHERLEEQRAQ